MLKEKEQASARPFKLKDYLLPTTEAVKAKSIEKVGTAYTISKNDFAVLDGVTCFTLEVWEDCMRLPHWHPNASELGYVISGTIEVIIWRSPGESAVFTLSAGMCWFIPQAALHSLNNIGKNRAKLLVGFSTDSPQDIDLPVAFNGIPAPIREAYTSPHSELRKWVGVKSNPLLGHYSLTAPIQQIVTASPYVFDLSKVTPLFSEPDMGSVIWAVKTNWNILENISLLRAHLKPNIARDPIWYPDVGTLYVVSQGRGQFHLIIANQDPEPLDVKLYDYVFVPTGQLHTFLNPYSEDFEVTAFFTNANPQPEVSLSVSTGFFPNTLRRAALTEYGNEHKAGDPLKDLKNTGVSPYLIRI